MKNELRMITPTFGHMVALGTIYQSGIVGADVDRIVANTNTFEAYFDTNVLDEYLEDGLIEIKNGRYVMTDHGKNVLGEVGF